MGYLKYVKASKYLYHDAKFGRNRGIGAEMYCDEYDHC
jgi:hypothetical protein